MNKPNYEGLKKAFASLGEGEKLYYGKSEVRKVNMLCFTVVHLSNIGREVYEEIHYWEAGASKFSIKRQLNFVSEPVVGVVFESELVELFALPLGYLTEEEGYLCLLKESNRIFIATRSLAFLESMKRTTQTFQDVFLTWD